MKEIALSNGMRIPTLGYGVFGITDPEQCERAVIDAVEAGYRLIDTAPGYENEEAVGRAVRHCGLPRGEVLVSTKLEASQMGSYDKAMRAFDRSLETMGLDYMDIYLFHWPMGDVYGAWRALEENYKAGRIKAIGVCNFWPYRLADFLLDQQTVPFINQIELHPFYQRKAEIAWNRNRNIQVQAWSPFAEGKNDIFNNPVLKAIGRKHGKSVAQVILRWLLRALENGLQGAHEREPAGVRFRTDRRGYAGNRNARRRKNADTGPARPRQRGILEQAGPITN
jgi:diketogulonate reductase-like aldo/keto reductase